MYLYLRSAQPVLQALMMICPYHSGRSLICNVHIKPALLMRSLASMYSYSFLYTITSFAVSLLSRTLKEKGTLHVPNRETVCSTSRITPPYYPSVSSPQKRHYPPPNPTSNSSKPTIAHHHATSHTCDWSAHSQSPSH
jgi:hypothetical protein